MSPRKLLLPVVGLACLLGTGIGGCDDPRAVEPTAYRTERIHHYATLFREREEDGPEHMARTVDLFGELCRERERALERRLHMVQEWARSDVQRWHDQQPTYRHQLHRLFYGDLQNAYDTIPMILY